MAIPNATRPPHSHLVLSLALIACRRFRRRRLKRLRPGTTGKRGRRSRQRWTSAVSVAQPRHSPSSAMAISSLSLHAGAGPLAGSYAGGN